MHWTEQIQCVGFIQHTKLCVVLHLIFFEFSTIYVIIYKYTAQQKKSAL